MLIGGENFNFVDTLNAPITVPDCFVKRLSKIGTGNGEAKLYIAPKNVMYPFFGNEGFVAKCFLLKSDLLSYMNALHSEYLNPSQPYQGADEMPKLWQERVAKMEVLLFWLHALAIILAFHLSRIKEISLPLVTYISVMQLADCTSGETLYYWKLFADFEAISDKKAALVFTYGKKGDKTLPTVTTNRDSGRQGEIRRARKGQGIYRDKMLQECRFCPITMINDERLLIASHIKPWAVSSDDEKLDPKNGFMLSPLYDKLFDRGLMTFTEDRRIILSNWLSPKNKERLGVKDGQFIQMLPLDDARQSYMQFHRKSVFKG